MNNLPLLEVNRRHLGIICLCVIAIILIAGLWPREFQFENQVALLPDGKGIRFSGRGVLYTKPLLTEQQNASMQGSLSIEMAVQPDKEWSRNTAVISAIDDGKACERLLIGQWEKYLVIRSCRKTCFQAGDYSQIELENALPKGKTQFITITSGQDGTTLYLAGVAVKKYRNFSLLRQGEFLSGRLILGNSGIGDHSWAGKVSTFAIYGQTLSDREVLQHYEAWQTNGSIFPKGNSLFITFYRFNERAGSVIKDHSGQGNDLIIPEFFIPLFPQILTPPWKDFQARKYYAMDVAINMLGFIPFGLYIAWYLSETGINHLRVVIIVILLGIGTSLLIEIIQAYLPERTSQLTDVISNTGGTVIGVYLWYRYILPFRQAHSQQ